MSKKPSILLLALAVVLPLSSMSAQAARRPLPTKKPLPEPEAVIVARRVIPVNAPAGAVVAADAPEPGRQERTGLLIVLLLTPQAVISKH